ncbi:MAG TPA: hypothetical protein VGD65_11450 [Chryseosolibacter sp.]
MIAAIQSKFENSIGQGIAAAFHVLNPVAAPGILTGGNPELANVTLLLILILMCVCVVGNLARVAAFTKITSTQTLR